MEKNCFKLSSTYEPCGDQPKAIKELTGSFSEGKEESILLGVTGSGKTFTITGGAEKYKDRGIIPRTLEHIFKKCHDENTKISVSYIEIYNESGYDLLDERHDVHDKRPIPLDSTVPTSNPMKRECNSALSPIRHEVLEHIYRYACSTQPGSLSSRQSLTP